MQCKYFSECGACVIYEGGYEAQLKYKFDLNKQRFAHLYSGDIEVFKSLDSHYRARSEFRIWHKDGEIFYAMNKKNKKETLLIDECPQVNTHIAKLMPQLLNKIKEYKIEFKLFGVDFLSSSSGDIVVSLLYHRQLDESWLEDAKKVAQDLNIFIIGRARKQKLVIGQDYIIEELNIAGKKYKFKHIENSFTQPNPRVNEKMIEWALKNSNSSDSDMLELYCGAGNFTIPFASKYRKILATEISKSSINAAKENMALNGVENIEFVRMSAEEFTQALDGVREFKRMAHIDINSYNIETIFVDPPRAGMDEESCKFTARYKNILYISCNPETLLRDLEILTKTHKVVSMAMFDQFPYTYHIEMGVKLVKI